MSATETTITISEDQATRIKRALAGMPYLPMSSNYHISAEPEKLAVTLECFADFLMRHADEQREMEAELHQLRGDVAAIRRIFGTEVS
jgi:hypothetical protein